MTFFYIFFSKITTSFPLYLLAKIFDIKKSTTTSNVYNKYILIGITWVLEIAYLKSQITSEAARLVKSALFIRNLIRGLTRGHRSEPIFSLCTWRYHTSLFAGERRTCVQLDTPNCCAYPGETLFRWVKICIYEIINENKSTALRLIWLCISELTRFNIFDSEKG